MLFHQSLRKSNQQFRQDCVTGADQCWQLLAHNDGRRVISYRLVQAYIKERFVIAEAILG